LICISWPEDGRNAAETCCQKPLICECYIVVYDVNIYIYAYNVTQRDGFRKS